MADRWGREKVEWEDIPDSWSSKWDGLHRYALRMARVVKNYRFRGKGSRHRRKYVSIDIYSDGVYVRASQDGPGVRGQRYHGVDIIQYQQEFFDGSMSPMDAFAIAWDVHEQTGVAVRVWSDPSAGERGNLNISTAGDVDGWIQVEERRSSRRKSSRVPAKRRSSTKSGSGGSTYWRFELRNGEWGEIRSRTPLTRSQAIRRIREDFDIHPQAKLSLSRTKE